MIEYKSTAPATDDEARLHASLLSTWLPVAAIAVITGMPVKTALAILQRRMHDWRLDCLRVRIDGHNAVFVFRKANEDRQMIMGVWMPIKPVEEKQIWGGNHEQ